MSYHGIYITTVDMPRTSLFDMPYGYELVISRVCGCVLYYRQGTRDEEPRVVASEFPLSSLGGMKVEYGNEVLCDSLPDTLYAEFVERGNRQEPSRQHRGIERTSVEIVIDPAEICPERRHVETAVAALEG